MARPSESTLDGYEVLLCVTGGIAAYKSAQLASRLVQLGCGVTVAMTEAAERFITPLTFQALTRRRVFTSMWTAAEDFRSQHISLTERADLMVVAPATADVIGKMAGGLADDLVSTMALSATGSCEILIAPAMNDRMFSAPAVRQNLRTLDGWGVHCIGPAEGNLACGTSGPGRMSEPAEIIERVEQLLRREAPKGLG
jgi:phosphopantothenoylcysteine decarboxylase/phosphopantothenate--cysteine ligase